MNALRSLLDVHPRDVLDILLVAVFIYVLLAGLRWIRVRRVAWVLAGLTTTYAFAEVVGMQLTVYLLRVSAAAIGLGFAIIYHDELRSMLERFARTLTRPMPFRNGSAGSAVVPAWVETLVASLFEMSRRKVGALVVLHGNDDLARHVSGGSRLDGIVSDALLMSIFDPNSLGHDGAVIVGGDRIQAFQTHLPLSEDFEQLQHRGTRHAAALGLAERTDALCLVVSEERGAVSFARDGRLAELDGPEAARETIEQFLREVGGDRVGKGQPFWTWPRLRPKLAAVVLAYVLWFLLAHEGATEYRSYRVPVRITGLEHGLVVTQVNPARVKVILSGPRRAFYFVSPRQVALEATLFDADPGEHELTLTASDVVRPDTLTIANIFPRVVEVRLESP